MGFLVRSGSFFFLFFFLFFFGGGGGLTGSFDWEFWSDLAGGFLVRSDCGSFGKNCFLLLLLFWCCCFGKI